MAPWAILPGAASIFEEKILRIYKRKREISQPRSDPVFTSYIMLYDLYRSHIGNIPYFNFQGLVRPSTQRA